MALHPVVLLGSRPLEEPPSGACITGLMVKEKKHNKSRVGSRTFCWSGSRNCFLTIVLCPGVLLGILNRALNHEHDDKNSYTESRLLRTCSDSDVKEWLVWVNPSPRVFIARKTESLTCCKGFLFCSALCSPLTPPLLLLCLCGDRD